MYPKSQPTSVFWLYRSIAFWMFPSVLDAKVLVAECAYQFEMVFPERTLGFSGIGKDARPMGTIQTDAIAVSNAPNPAENQEGTFGKNCSMAFTVAINKNSGP